MRNKSSSFNLYMSSSSFGSWPVPVMLALFTRNGGKISLYPCWVVCRSSIKLISALSSNAPKPLKRQKPEPDILEDLGKSSISRSSPISICVFGLKSNFLGSPHFLTSLLFSAFPIGIELWGIFGIKASNCLIFYQFPPLLYLNCLFFG